jgi:hypothetical protein
MCSISTGCSKAEGGPEAASALAVKAEKGQATVATAASQKHGHKEAKKAKKANKAKKASGKKVKAKSGKKAKKSIGKKAKSGQKKAAKHTKSKKEKALKQQHQVAAAAVGRQSAGSCLATNCMDLAVAYIGLLRTKVTNYQKQLSRLSKIGTFTAGKSSKQTAFVNSINQLLTIGGGNKSNLTCGTSTNNSGMYSTVQFSTLSLYSIPSYRKTKTYCIYRAKIRAPLTNKKGYFPPFLIL